MAKGKIAPLTIEAVECYWLSSETPEGRQARAELRALLAVARAARRLNKYVWPDGTPNGTVQAPLARALARLDRVSGAREGTP